MSEERRSVMTMPLLVPVLPLLLLVGGSSSVSMSYEDVSLRSVECPVSNPSLANCTGMYDQQLRDFIDNIVANMDKPNEQLGLPPLDPLVLDGLSLNLANGFIDVTGNLSLVAEGLRQLEVPFAHFCLSGFQLFLNASLPSLTVSGSYALDGWLGGDLLYVFGDGAWALNVTGVQLYVNVGLKSNTTGNHMYVDHLELALDIATISVEIEGLYHDADVSEVLSDVLNLAVPTLLRLYKQQVTCFATDAVASLLDQKLLTVSMGDLLCIIAGFGC